MTDQYPKACTAVYSGGSFGSDRLGAVDNFSEWFGQGFRQPNFGFSSETTPKISLVFLGLLPSSVSGVREWFGINFGIGVATEKISQLSSSYATESRTVNHQVGGSGPSGGVK